MLFSSEEELDELLTHQVICQPRNFEERWLSDMKNPREVWKKFCLPVDAVIYLLEF